MKWADVKNLHLEIGANCNAACPQCTRHPLGTDFLLPSVESSPNWTLSELEHRLPLTDLQNIDSFLLNGNFGDFLTHPTAIEILRYLKSAKLESKITVNTNGSARNKEWWTELASIPNLTVNFAIDGLEDTHALYRRNTSWNLIIDNAKTFIAAGGVAEWTMTLFKHNEHQLEECQSMAKDLGFSKFNSRFSSRGNMRVVSRDKTYWIEQSTKIPIKRSIKIGAPLTVLKEIEDSMRSGRYRAVQDLNDQKIHLETAEECDSLRGNSVYIGADWFVVPCCYIGTLSFRKFVSTQYLDFISKAEKSGIDINSLFANNDRSVKDVVDQGFDWIYSRLFQDDCLSVCATCCSKSNSNFKKSRDYDKTDNYV